MTTQKELRKSLHAGVRAALAQRSFRRKRRTDRYVSRELVEAPLEAELVVGVDSDRYGSVRIMGSADIVVPQVEEFLAAVPPSALTEVQEVYYGELPFAVAMETFDTMDGVHRTAPLTWQAHTTEDALAALEEFTEYVDGPVRRWIDAHSSVAAVRAAPGAGGAEVNGSTLRGVAALDVVVGDLEAAVARLEAYRPKPSRSDTPERVDTFLDWLKQAAADGSREFGSA